MTLNLFVSIFIRSVIFRPTAADSGKNPSHFLTLIPLSLMSLPSPQKDPWPSFIEIIKQSIPRESYHTWFGALKLVKQENYELTVQVPSQFYYDWIEEHYSEQIEQALFKTYGAGYKLCYSIVEKETSELMKLGPSKNSRVIPRKTPLDLNLNPRYTFKNFIEGDCNSFAKAAALAAAGAPGRTKFNPLVIYGGVGLGKTHLVQAIGNFAVKNKTLRKALYVSSEQFTSDFISSIKQQKTSEFSNFFRSVDLLIVDDVQFFKGKERTQMEFFHTFNTLYQSGKQVVLSMDRPPSELTEIESRLHSRLQWGLVTDIQPPDFETRVAILHKRADDDNLNLEHNILEFIAASVTSNIRELEGALIKIMAHASITGQDIDLPLAKKLLKDVIRERPFRVSVERIQEIVADWSKIPSDLLRGNSRKKEISLARHIAIYLCSEMTNLTLKSIGSHFGNRDHSTVIHAIETSKKLMNADQTLIKEIEQLKKKLELSI